MSDNMVIKCPSREATPIPRKPPKPSQPYEMPSHEDLEDFMEEAKGKPKKVTGATNVTEWVLRRESKAQKALASIKVKDKSSSKQQLPISSRDYLWAAKYTAIDKHIYELAEKEQENTMKGLQKEKEDIITLEKQIGLHNQALENFLVDHYSEVDEALKKNEEATLKRQEQEERLDYFSGLLKAAKTMQEEDREVLQELKSFQDFLAAVTPKQSLHDLQVRLTRVRANEEDEQADTTQAREKPRDQKHKRQTSPVSKFRYLESEVQVLRMVDLRSADLSSKGESNPLENNMEPDFDPRAYDEHLEDSEYLVNLSRVYENQCHGLLSLRTRLLQKIETLQEEEKDRKKKLEKRLCDLKQLEEKSEESQERERHLQDTEKLIENWSTLSNEEEAKAELNSLGQQISLVVNDVFGSKTSVDLSDDSLSQFKSDLFSQKKWAGLGQNALLALLESRVTDLCGKLESLPAELRDQVFMKCEKERKLQIKEDKRLNEERTRDARRQKHLQRAMASPPPRKS